MANFSQREGEILNKYDKSAQPAPKMTPEEKRKALQVENDLVSIAVGDLGMTLEDVDELIMKGDLSEWDKVFNGDIPQQLIKEVAHPEVGMGDRFVLKNFSNPEEQLKFFEKRGLDARMSGDDRILIKEKGKNARYYHPLDPDMWRTKTQNLKIKDMLRESLMEASDVGTSFARGLAVGAAGVAGGAAGFLSPVPGGALLGAMAGAGLADMGIQSLEQGVGQLAGVREGFDGGEILMAGGVSAASGGLLGAGMSTQLIKRLAVKNLTDQISKAALKKVTKGEIVNKLGGRFAANITGYNALQTAQKAVESGNRGLLQHTYRFLTRDVGAGVPAALTGTKKDALLNYVRKYDKMTSIHQNPALTAGNLARRSMSEADKARTATGQVLWKLRNEIPDAEIDIRPIKDEFTGRIAALKTEAARGGKDPFIMEKINNMQQGFNSLFYRKKMADTNLAARAKISVDDILPYRREEQFQNAIDKLELKKKGMGLTKNEAQVLRRYKISKDVHHTDKYAPFFEEVSVELPDTVSANEEYDRIRETINAFNDFNSRPKDGSKLTEAERAIKDLGMDIYHKFENAMGDGLSEIDPAIGQTYRQAKDIYIRDKDRSDYLKNIFGVGEGQKKTGDMFDARARRVFMNKDNELSRHLIELDGQQATIDFENSDIKDILKLRLNTDKFNAPIIRKPKSLLEDMNDLYSYETIGPTSEDLGVIGRSASSGAQKAREAGTALGQSSGVPITPGQGRLMSRLFGDRPRGAVQAGRGLRAIEQGAGKLRSKIAPDINYQGVGFNPVTQGLKGAASSPWVDNFFNSYFQTIEK